jgi:hypothetical protein
VLMLLMSHVAVVEVVATLSTAEEHVGSTSAEEHPEDVIRVKLVLPEVLLVPLIETLLCAMLIVDPSHLLVA